ncbi:GNAT family N-acetyltransferase [Psychroserpens sp. SPM9]|uniref:GNAT family N-acetyltransferase n=1 Tax=Psychroserpens sp. SPM9 TaxID=2975598 RepID=UPI0021A6369E|nr:GNAT family N-acetyltransferase [Psychroserpens sp. SPM9]MDG5491583.1 GNAT family N-acetyltransferase [Psychroserpens sp. SPM9]
MRTNYINVPLKKNEEKKRFEIEVDGSFAFIIYKEKPSQIALIHTETDAALAGKGAASAVVEKTLQYIEDHNKLLLPLCPYVFAYIKKHPEWKRIVDTHFKGYDKL